MATKERFQHTIPQPNANDGHVAEPVRFKTGRVKRLVCATCGKWVKRVDENEGPEGLKAFFRF